MMNQRWVAAAFTSDALVAELLLRLKQSASSHVSPPPTTSTTTATTTASLNPVRWGDRKSRSKPPSTAAFSVTNGFGKGQQRSPSTPLSWSNGGAPSTSDGCDESSRPSDLSSGDRYVKVESSTTHMDNKSRKRKIDLHRVPKKEVGKFIQVSGKVESEIEIRKRQFVLPDLNETPVAYEELAGL
ncbi:unnamed protein product [Lactuca virosa]|uniref:Uncharacterized protein n=1 Tax=Lactuca virosa TaxID=75947 RepID=A0AAU9NWU7_9ASTR|nr:unnamed protein product [Lactuca virosa]